MNRQENFMTTNQRRILVAVVAVVLSAFARHARALEIPVAGESGGAGTGGGVKIGYVDMDRIFQIYPQTRDAKEDYAKQLARKRQQLADKEAELQNLKGRIAVLESTLKDMSAQNPPPGTPASADAAQSSGTLHANPPPIVDEPRATQSISDMKRDLEQKQAEYEDLRKRAADDLAAFESKQSQLILGKIYQALRDLAEEEQVTMVVDKASILYGSADIDLTERLQARVRGY